MEFENIIEALQGNAELTNKTLVALKETEQGKQLLNNYADAYASNRIKEVTKETYTNVDTLLTEAGFEKQGGEKTTDYLARFVSTFQDVNGKKGATAREKELAQQLEALKSDGSHNAHWKQTHEEAANKWSAEKETLVQQLNEIQNAQVLNSIKGDLQAATSGLSFNPSIPAEAVKAMEQMHINSLMQSAKVEGGKVVYYDENGAPILNDTYAPADAQYILKQRLASVLHNTQAGGNASTINKDGSASSPVPTGLQIQTRVSLVKHFQETAKAKGIAPSTPEYNNLFISFRDKYDYYSLPEK